MRLYCKNAEELLLQAIRAGKKCASGLILVCAWRVLDINWQVHIFYRPSRFLSGAGQNIFCLAFVNKTDIFSHFDDAIVRAGRLIPRGPHARCVLLGHAGRNQGTWPQLKRRTRRGVEQQYQRREKQLRLNPAAKSHGEWSPLAGRHTNTAPLLATTSKFEMVGACFGLPLLRLCLDVPTLPSLS